MKNSKKKQYLSLLFENFGITEQPTSKWHKDAKLNKKKVKLRRFELHGSE